MNSPAFSPKIPSLPRSLLAALAAIFAAATILYSLLWMYSNRWQLPVELGFDEQYVASGHYELIRSVYEGSPAERAGLKPGDRILEINGHQLENDYYLGDVWAKHRPGDAVELTIKRPNVSAPFVTTGVFRASRPASKEGALTERLSRDITNTYPVAFLVVGLAVLFLRLEDPDAWLLALMFGGFIAIPGPMNSFAGMDPGLRSFAVAYRGIFGNIVSALFYFFFAVFPTRSQLDRRLPWLKWISLMLGASVALPAVFGRFAGGNGRIITLSFLYGLIALGFVSLIWNAFSATPEARRKIRVILWGTLVGVVPATLLLGAGDFFGFHPPAWLAAAIVLLLWLFPLSFAYAVVKHRVMEIPVLLKRSARYMLVQRGFIVLLFIGAVLAFVLFGHALSALLGQNSNAGMTLSAVFGVALVWTSAPFVKRGTERIDKAFFRNAYDARIILQDLAEKTRTATDRQELAALMERHLNEALRPSSFAAYLETQDNQLSAACGDVPPELHVISATEPMLAELARRGRPWEVPDETETGVPELFLLAPLQPDCLVPMLGRDSRLVGVLVLGPRLSEEPYSGEDKHLLASVASQAGIALESIRLGEKIAERIDAERRAAQEMEFAREVQVRLFPQKLPPLRTLEYTGGCIPAREIGGDYYDFLELRPGRVALVLADIAGKGVSGALLMANLQANLRSQYAMALDDVAQLLRSVNHLFYENTTENSYATLFFADYDDSTRRLRYVNCGHLPPLILRADGSGVVPTAGGNFSSTGPATRHTLPLRDEGSEDRSGSQPAVQRLEPTCTVLGLFDEWESAVAEVQLAPGDTLVLYTDGVTEAENAQGEQFGECRLVETLRAHHDLPAASLLETIVAAVQRFSGCEQADDITLVVARCKS
jgi:phosphoserine phosphatase RsbU/P